MIRVAVIDRVTSERYVNKAISTTARIAMRKPARVSAGRNPAERVPRPDWRDRSPPVMDESGRVVVTMCLRFFHTGQLSAFS